MKEQTLWIDCLSNGQAVRSVFGQSVPQLRGLELVQLVVHAAGDLAITLNMNSLPDVVPTRWKEKGCDRLQLKLRFAIGALVVRRDDVLGGQKVSVDLAEGQLHVVSDDGAFELTSVFFDARIYFFPYESNRYEFPPTWYSPY
jgi:hypothetical protein